MVGHGRNGSVSVRGAVCLTLLGALALSCRPLGAQEIPKADYISYVPLDYPRIVRQTDPSRDLRLFGDQAAPGYRDVNPKDGIDDSRGRALMALAQRFAPYLVQNTTNVPMDHLQFMNEAQTWPLFFDTWDLTREPELVGEDRIDMISVDRSPCPGGRADRGSPNDDCRLLSVLSMFDPDNPTHERARTQARAAQGDPFHVMYYNFPGYDEETWKEEYTNPHSHTLPERYRSFVKTYVHPFINPVRSNVDEAVSYELVLQYWFFYPSNDGGNNHEGDWEHVAVVVTPLSRIGRPLDAEQIQGMLDVSRIDDPDDPLVIGRLDYYIHNHVMQLDLSRPNVYQPRADWEREVETTQEQMSGQRWIWRQLRRRAWVDDAETVINTHPLGYIGADNKGTDQILAMPGGKNRDSHATYPFAGLYKDIGPAGASEEIRSWLDYRTYLQDPTSLNAQPFGRGWVQRLDEPGRIQIVPDWERIHPLLADDPVMRKQWSWLILPVRWGYPATVSPFAGVVSHAETGNLSVTGPAYSSGWNRSGASGGFTSYEPHRFSGFFALGWQDTFLNDWGFLNATLPTLTIVPPFDLVFRVVGAPVRAMTGRHSSTFYDQATTPYRFIGVVGGYGHENLPTDFAAMLINRDQIAEIFGRIQEADSTLTTPLGNEFADDGRSWFAGVSMFVGKKFETQNLVKRMTATVGEDLALSTLPEPFRLEAQLDLWEYVGSVRYSLSTGRLQPFGRAGWGWSWYRVTDASTQGVVLDTPNSPWVDTFTYHFGFGLEFLPITGSGKGLHGLDVGIRGDFLWFRHKLSLDQIADPIFVAAGQVTQGSVTRRQISLALTLSY